MDSIVHIFTALGDPSVQWVWAENEGINTGMDAGQVLELRGSESCRWRQDVLEGLDRVAVPALFLPHRYWEAVSDYGEA